MRIAVALLTVAVVAFGQDCRDCPSAAGAKAAKKATPTLSGKIYPRFHSNDHPFH